jgi:hypothetical protein
MTIDGFRKYAIRESSLLKVKSFDDDARRLTASAFSIRAMIVRLSPGISETY